MHEQEIKQFGDRCEIFRDIGRLLFELAVLCALLMILDWMWS